MRLFFHTHNLSRCQRLTSQWQNRQCPIFSPNPQTNTNTYYIHHVIPYTPNVLFLSVWLLDYAAFVLPTRPSHFVPMNLLTIFTNVAVTAISFNGKYNELIISHGQKHLRPITPPHWTKKNVLPSLSLTTQPYVPSHPLFANTFTSLFHLPLAITFLKLHLL